MRISDWSSDVCSSDLHLAPNPIGPPLSAFPLLRFRPRALRLGMLAPLDLLLLVIRSEAFHPPFDNPLPPLVGFQEIHRLQIGRASCRERVCQYVYISVVAVSLKKKK